MWTKIGVSGKISTVIPDDNSADWLNQVIESLFSFKNSQDAVTPCLVIIDECQKFDLQQSAPLISLLLRQGRKFGIMAFLATQYLTAENGRNISLALKQCGTLFAFKPGDDPEIIRMLGWNAKDPEKSNALAEIGRYSCAASGNLSTSRCSVSYPLFIDIQG